MSAPRSHPRQVWRRTPSVLCLAIALGAAACGTDPVQPTVRPERPLLQVGGVPSVYAQVVSGSSVSCALRTDGVVDCWGPGVAVPSITPTTAGFTQFALGNNHSCALRTDGIVECWGSNTFNQAPGSRAAGSGRFTQVATTGDYSCALRQDGVIECWGDDTFGQAPASKTAADGKYFVQLSNGRRYACALRSDGEVECWGDNLFEAAPATKAAASGSFVQVGTGSFSACAVRADGVVECWGYDQYGSAPAIKSATTGKFVQVSPGLERFACALRDDGAVECWGDDSFGQAPPLKTAAIGRFVQVSSGVFHACALRDDGALECWGDNTDGRAPALRTAPNLTLSGFEAPIDNAPLVNVAKAGRIVPVRWRVTDLNGAPVLTLQPRDMAFSVRPLACQASASTVPLEAASATGGPGLLNLGNGYYQLNWATAKEWGGTCKTIELVLAGGRVRQAHFDFTK